LRLNRPPLLALRRARREVAMLRESLVAEQAEQARLRERMTALERDLQVILVQLSQFKEP
jgi:hypothetical protein